MWILLCCALFLVWVRLACTQVLVNKQSVDRTWAEREARRVDTSTVGSTPVATQDGFVQVDAQAAVVEGDGGTEDGFSLGEHEFFTLLTALHNRCVLGLTI